MTRKKLHDAYAEYLFIVLHVKALTKLFIYSHITVKMNDLENSEGDKHNLKTNYPFKNTPPLTLFCENVTKLQ